MKTVKTTLIVLVTLVGVFIIVFFLIAAFQGYSDKKKQQEQFDAHVSHNIVLDSLVKTYINKEVTLGAEDINENKVPIYKEEYDKSVITNEITLTKVTLLDVDVYNKEGSIAKIFYKGNLTQSTEIGFVSCKNILEFQKANDLLKTD